MTNTTDALPVQNVSDRTSIAQQPAPGKLDGGQILTERDSTQLVNSMKAGSPSSSEFLTDMQLYNGQQPNAPREMPSWIEMHNNVSKGTTPELSGPKPDTGGNTMPRGEQGSKSLNENIHLAGVQIIEDEEDQFPEANENADSKPHPRDEKKPVQPGESNSKAHSPEQNHGPNHERNVNPVPEFGEGPNAPREIPSEDPAQHPRKTTPEEFKKELDLLNLSPEAKEIAHDLTDAFAKGKLKDIVDSLSEVVKEHSKDPESMKEAVGAFTKLLRKYGISEPMSVTDEGALVFGSGAITIEPDGKVVVKPVQKAS